MIIGTFSFKLRAVNNSSLPVSHGRLLHAALLDLVRQYDKDLSAQLHDSNVKPFSFGLLNLYPKKSEAGKFKIEIGNSVVWKVNSLDTRLTRFLIGMQSGFIIRIGSACFQVDDIRYYDNCIIGTEKILENAENLAAKTSFSIRFVSPTSFRYYDIDYPFPRIDLIFGSLIDRWNNIDENVAFDSDALKAVANQYIIPVKWQGESKRFNLTPKHGITGYIGTYMFDMKQLPKEYRKIFFALLEFAKFSGIGRLTAQGLGQVKVEYL